MYVQKRYEEKDKANMLGFMRQYPFGLLVSIANNRPWATHLPFNIEEDGETIKLYAHQSKANTQWKELNEDTEVLAIFNQPHAFISPRHYDHEENVPTWNYLAVHAYGKAKLFHDKENKERILRKAIQEFDQGYEKQYGQLDEKYLVGMMDGIVALEVAVTDMQAQFKLSQNKTAAERQRIISELKNSADGTISDLAQWMEKYPYKK